MASTTQTLSEAIVEIGAKAMCERWCYAPIGTPDGDAEWKRKQDQYRKQTRAALEATTHDLIDACRCALGHLTGNMDGDMDLGDPVEMLRTALSKATS